MSVIQIREQGVVENGFEVSLYIDGQDYGQVVVKAPFAVRGASLEENRPQQDNDLTWYFEKWLRMPFVDQVRAARSASSVRDYGMSLFKQVFANPHAFSAYDRLKHDLENLEIEIIGAATDFQAWHWEALCDPELPRPLAVDCRLTRKHTKRTAVAAVVKPWPVVNVLLVTARPDEEDDVGYRTISRSMVEMVKNAHLRVNIEILRPATYEALTNRLTERGAGYYHILHFDGHGALMTYEQYLQGMKGDRLSFQRGYGLGNLQEYAGSKAFLFFDGDAKGQSVPVEAAELAGLLQGKQIPVCILNACQSAMQLTDGRETSLGSQLMAAGMQAVVAMGYAVTVTAARVLMTKLYGELFAGKDFATAVRLGRYEMYNDKQRKGAFNTWIDLEDWLLPVVYGSSAVNLNLREFAPAEEEVYYEGLGSRYQFPLPSYGFVGRDLEILKIEKGLLRHNVLLLRGMGGTGKTTLLCYLREWWQTTNFADDVFYFGYDERAWTLAQILFTIGQRIYDKFECARFVAMSVAAQVPKLAEKLRSSNYILVLDNLESVTGQQLAIQNTLNATEQEELRDFLVRLVGGKTRVVLGSRSGEEWLQGVFRQNVYVLRGLDLEARSELAEVILQRQVAASRVKEIKADADFGRLMGLLAGYPLAMEVVLANLRRQSPGEILTALRLADVGLDGAGQDKTTSILKCVEYSHSNLSESAQQLLLCLAPFSSFICRTGIPWYVEELKKLEPFKDYDFAGFDDAIQEAINWGLLSLIDVRIDSLLSIQPIFPYFLQMRLNESIAEIQEALQDGFKNYYLKLADSYRLLLQSNESENKTLGILLCKIEYENLFAALQICIIKHESVSIYFCLYKYFAVINDTDNRLAITEKVYENMKFFSSYNSQQESDEIITVLDYAANIYGEIRNINKAEEIYQEKIKVVEGSQYLSINTKKIFVANTYRSLGAIALQEKQWDDAYMKCLQALSIYIEAGDRYDQADVYFKLGSILQRSKKWEEARNNYLLSIEIYAEFDNRYDQAGIYHQLGTLEEELGEWDKAARNYHKSLEIKTEFNDSHSQASTYCQLGTLAQRKGEWSEAKKNYYKALEIYMKFGDRFNLGSTYHNLGIVARKLKEYEEAHNYYNQALEIKVEFGDYYLQASTYGELGLLAAEEEDPEKTVDFLLKALRIFVKFKDQDNVHGTIKRLSVMYQFNQSMELIAEISSLLEVSELEVQQIFDTMSQGT